MKNLSLILNAVLLAAVSFLFYKQFAGGAKDAGSGSDSVSTAAPAAMLPAASLSGLPKGVSVVFIDVDTLYARYEYATTAKAAAESRLNGYQQSYQTKVQNLQDQYNDYIDKAGAGKYSKEEALRIEADLKKQKAAITTMEENQDKVMKEVDKATLDVQKTVFSYLTRFNKEHGYYCALGYTRLGGNVLGISDSLDVTNTVLDGLNAEYKAKGK